MAYLGRKFTSAKWTELEGNPCADGVTFCLRTKGNTLSFWRSENLDEANVKDIVLAFVANGEKIEKLEIVLIDENFFEEKSLDVEITDGFTKVGDLVNKHRDIVGLNIKKLEQLSSEILHKVKEFSELEDNELESYSFIKMFSAEEVKQILLDAIDAGRLDKASLSKPLKALI